MGRFTRIKDMPIPKDEWGNSLCRQCGMLVPKNRKAYCQDACMHEFVQTHTWSFVRKRVLREARYRCAICDVRKRKAELDVDHIIPLMMGGQPFLRENLRVLCRECHRAKSRLDRDATSKFR